MLRIVGVLGVLLAAFLLLQPVAFAQSQFATLSGTVTDSTGGVIVGASITVKPAHSADTRKTVTNQDGFFSVPTLPAGTYEVTVDMKGFKKWHGTDITLNGADSRSMNIQLQVGAATESVIVEGQVTELATKDSGEKSATISTKDMNELSLVGRNAVEYLKILPGAILSANGAQNKLADSGETVMINAAVGAGGGALSNMTINGQNVDVTQDGQRVVDPGSNNLVPVNPNPDMISEVKVLTSNFTSENAKGPVVMNSVTKGGGSDFHGSAYMYARNTALNSTEHNFVANKLPNPKPASSYYFPGGNLGGPLLIPGTGFNKSRKKLFFFEAFEYYKQQLNGGAERAYVPDAKMLNGDFSELLNGYGTNVGRGLLATVPTAPAAGSRFGYDLRAAAGCTITNAVLSSACIDPVAQIYLKDVMPAANIDPTTNGGFNFATTYSVPQNSWQNVTREDWVISDYTKLYVSWSRQRETNNWPVGLWVSTCDWCVPSPSPIVGKNGSDFVSGTFVHVFSPTMTMEGRIGYMKESLVNSPTNPDKFFRDKVGYPLKGIYSDTNIPAITSWGDSTPNLGEVGYDYHPKMVAYKGIPSGAVNLTKVIGTHSTKYGFYYEHAYNKQDNWQQYQGTITYASWSGATTSGNQYADMLMGIGQQGFYQQGPPVTIELAQNISSLYAQDDWKVTRRLSIQYGLRFEHYAKPYSPGFGLAVFDPSKYDASAAPGVNTGVSWHAIDSADPLSGSKSRFLFLSPRLGAAYDLFGNGKTVVRGGWGKYRAYDSVQNRTYTDPAGTALGIVSWSNCGSNDSRCPTWESYDQFAYTPVLGHPNLQGTAFTSVSPKNDEQPLVEAYSLSIDQELPGKFKAEISYVGNRSPIQLGSTNINSVPVGALIAPGFTCPPGTGNITSGSCQQTLRPFQLYQGITQVLVVGKSRFDSLQASLMRYYGWLTLQANYTFSKNLGEGPGGLDGSNGPFTGALKDYGAKWLYGIDNLNRAHMLSLAYVFTLPKTKSSNAFVKNAFDNWQISGITQVASGPQLNQSNGQSLSFTYSGPLGNVQQLGTPDINQYPLITCNPKSHLGKNQYLNPNCFTTPGIGQLGTAGMPYLSGPMFWNTDLTLLKSWQLTERKSLQFRFAAFNPLNHALPSFNSGDGNLHATFNDLGQMITGASMLPNTDPNSYNGACKQATIDANHPNGIPCTGTSTFGVATSIWGQRKLELGLKFTF